MSLLSLPRGWRNNNPGNIEAGSFAQGLPGYLGSDGRFAIFSTPQQGINAANTLLGSYSNRGYDTVSEIIGRWAPSSENNTNAYINFVSTNAGVNPNTPLSDAERGRVADAMFTYENGMSTAQFFGAPPGTQESGGMAADPLPNERQDGLWGWLNGPLPDYIPGEAGQSVGDMGGDIGKAIESFFQRSAVIILGFIFVAVGLSMFKLIPNPITIAKNAVAAK